MTPQVEPHSTKVMASLDANYVPLSSDTVARGQGTNLSAFFTTDYAGNPRPATGPWTIGAYEYDLSAPRNLTIINNGVIMSGTIY